MRSVALADADLDALARGGGGVDVARSLVRARRGATLLLTAAAVRADPRAEPALRALARLPRAAVDRVLDDPATGAWAAATARGAAPATDLAFAAAAAAIRAGVPVELSFPQAGSGFLPSLGPLVEPVSGPCRTDRLRWTPAPVVPVDGHALAVSPLPAHLFPPDLPQATPGDHSALIREAWRTMADALPGTAAEFAAMITTLVPLSAPDGHATSSTVTDALGAVFLTFNTDAEALAATLVHELHHAKLAVVMDIHALTKPSATRYHAPWRPDPRPAGALLHGVYAFLGVAGFWRRRPGSERARAEFDRWRTATLAAAGDLLAGDDLTARGRRFVTTAAGVLRGWG
ncbi:HEXXH motif-containing putative peptide modification protein [Actinokineospora soli]|uniref:HEXXH motif-containing putative peptide modification protein n=1 Tax=Actinokineospora soli TaxID=1048753 RepID=A0ABW2TUM8_9PSEU